MEDAHHLFADRRGAPNLAESQQILQQGMAPGQPVAAPMLVETSILGDDHCLLQEWRDLVQRQLVVEVQRIFEGCRERLAVAVELAQALAGKALGLEIGRQGQHHPLAAHKQ